MPMDWQAIIKTLGGEAIFLAAASTVAYEQVPKLLLEIQEAARAVVEGEPTKKLT